MYAIERDHVPHRHEDASRPRDSRHSPGSRPAPLSFRDVVMSLPTLVRSFASAASPSLCLWGLSTKLEGAEEFSRKSDGIAEVPRRRDGEDPWRSDDARLSSCDARPDGEVVR